MALRLSEHDPRPFETALGQVIFELDGVFQSLYADRNQSSLLASLSLADMPVTQRSVEDRHFVLSFVAFAQDAVKTIADTKEWIDCDFWLWDSDSSERAVLLSAGIAGFTLIIVFNFLIILAFAFRRRELLVPQVSFSRLATFLRREVGVLYKGTGFHPAADQFVTNHCVTELLYSRFIAERPAWHRLLRSSAAVVTRRTRLFPVFVRRLSYC